MRLLRNTISLFKRLFLATLPTPNMIDGRIMDDLSSDWRKRSYTCLEITTATEELRRIYGRDIDRCLANYSAARKPELLFGVNLPLFGIVLRFRGAIMKALKGCISKSENVSVWTLEHYNDLMGGRSFRRLA